MWKTEYLNLDNYVLKHYKDVAMLHYLEIAFLLSVFV